MNYGVFCVEKKEFDIFMAKYTQGEYTGQRLGQAFYNHFKLHKMHDQAVLSDLYETDGEKAINLIKKIFVFT